jgi:hypothetical protein
MTDGQEAGSDWAHDFAFRMLDDTMRRARCQAEMIFVYSGGNTSS